MTRERDNFLLSSENRRPHIAVRVVSAEELSDHIDVIAKEIAIVAADGFGLERTMTAERIKAKLAQEPNVILAYDKSELVGFQFQSIHNTDTERYLYYSRAIKKTYQRKGIARRLLEKAIDNYQPTIAGARSQNPSEIVSFEHTMHRSGVTAIFPFSPADMTKSIREKLPEFLHLLGFFDKVSTDTGLGKHSFSEGKLGDYIIPTDNDDIQKVEEYLEKIGLQRTEGDSVFYCARVADELVSKKQLLPELEETRERLHVKSIAEGRSVTLYSQVKGFESTVIGDLLVNARRSGKDPVQAILLLSSAVGYISGENPKGWSKEKLELFVMQNFFEVESLMRENNLSKNMGQRALPILLLLAEQGQLGPLDVIELGASTGLIGRALIKAEAFIHSLDQLTDVDTRFKEYAMNVFTTQGIPQVASYTGVDIKIPSIEWNFHCIYEDELRKQFQTFLAMFPDSETHQRLIQQSAIGFSRIPELMILQKPVVITSMMMYQLNDVMRAQLTSEIQNYLLPTNGYWVSLDYDAKINRFVGILYRMSTSGPQELKRVLLAKGEGIEWELP